MDISEMAGLSIIDCHTHFGGEDLDAIDAMLEQEAASGIEQMTVLISSFPGRVNANPEGLYAKARHPERIYLFAGLDYSAIAKDVDHRWTYSLAQQIDRLAAMGCDGIKMLNGKPNYRQSSGLALDCVIYDDYFARLEERGFPVLWHVNDPEEFWNPEEAPEWAKGPGWLYDETSPSKESIYQECERVLAKHPKLKIIFAHFYFLSDDLPRAAALLDRYSNVSFDLAPGIEMLHNFAKRVEEARDFFVKYQDRIAFGTDFGPGGLDSRLWVVRNFLETDEEFHVPTDERLFWPDHRAMIRGIALPEEVLRKIYAENFRRQVSPAPRPLNRELVLAELDRLTVLQDALGAKPNAARRVAVRLAGESNSEGDWSTPYLGRAL
ncbi:MAG: amidohydrolase family protein [Armatimonadota bacterium]|nr:MAG: amidohydrolase family protein [Armatimonadota bacterium]